MMKSRGEKAVEHHINRLNCAQSVACAFLDRIDVSKEITCRALEGFGAGMGKETCVCGAISGAIYVLGLAHSDGKMESCETKQATYALAGEIVERFYKLHGTTLCKDLRHRPGQPGQNVCNQYIADAAEIADQVLFEGGSAK